MNIAAILQNHVLLTGLIGWILAQALKIPIDLFRSRKWNWALFFAAGGMPSSHSALMVGATVGVGLHVGFNSAEFALAIAMTMIVIYDAAGVRREAGRHAEKINILINELLAGHPISDKELREVLGHTPMEVVGGVFLGLVVGILYWMYIG